MRFLNASICSLHILRTEKATMNIPVNVDGVLFNGLDIGFLSRGHNELVLD